MHRTEKQYGFAYFQCRLIYRNEIKMGERPHYSCCTEGTGTGSCICYFNIFLRNSLKIWFAIEVKHKNIVLQLNIKKRCRKWQKLHFSCCVGILDMIEILCTKKSFCREWFMIRNFNSMTRC